eukprot:TRINITY_DN18244_c0_g1_i1.p1 TRINITY_DN18244_c0_g1~~TRINITY_DN18244_c0_g1_i1.p1  ORF type:complete len:383 (+),score=93.67 TRINITY_DN18244_c0_g1_i1:97-1245(+)
MAGGEGCVVVVEVGETVRVGVSGQVHPEVCIPAYTAGGRPLDAGCGHTEVVRSILPMGADWAFSDTGSARGLGTAIQTAASQLGAADPLKTPSAGALVVVPYYASSRVREQLASMCFGQLGVDSCYIITSPVAALASVGMSTGLHLDCGARDVTLCNVTDGVMRPRLSQLGRVAGARLTEVVADALGNAALRKVWAAGGQGREEAKDGVHGYHLLKVAEAMKEEFCYVPEGAADDGRPAVALGLPDGSEVTLSRETLRTPGYLFDPELHGSIPQIFRSVFAACCSDQRYTADPAQLLDSGVVVTGGVTLTRGFIPRLHTCLRETFPSHRLQVPVAHHTPLERRAAPWIGGSIAATYLPPDLWVTREEFEEEGRRIVEQKCPA